MVKLKDIKKTINLIIKKKLIEVPLSNRLEDKVVVITGTSTGLGKALAEYFHNSGAKVACLSRSEGTNSDKLITIKCDITNESSVEQAFAEIIKAYGKVDALINNAALTQNYALHEMTDTIISDYLAVNIKALALTSKHAVRNKVSTIINIGSKVSRNSMVQPGKALYTATKYAVEGFTNVLKNELRPQGIRVIAVLPSAMTNFVSSKAGNHLSPYRVAEIIGDIIRYDEVDYENFVIKGKDQEI